MALTSDSKLIGWGSNSEGQVGQTHEEYVLVPKDIEFLFPIISIDCCEGLSFIVDIDENAFYWGKTSNKWKPNQINALF